MISESITVAAPPEVVFAILADWLADRRPRGDGERDPLCRHREGEALGEEAVDAGGGLQVFGAHLVVVHL